MFKILGALFQFLRNTFLKVGGFFFEKMRDPETHKIKWLNPKDLKTILTIVFVVLAAIVIIYQLATSNISFISGNKDYQEELNNKVGINAEEQPAREDLDDPLGNYKSAKGPDNDGPKDALDPNGPLDYGVCISLLEKLKQATPLNFDERIILKRCLDSNETNLEPSELALAKLLANSALLSEADRKLLAEAFGSDQSCQAEMNDQIKTPAGNDFVSKVLEDPMVNQSVVKLLQNPETLRQSVINPEAMRNSLEMTKEEFVIFQSLLEKCDPATLLRLLSDPKYKEVMQKLLKAALEDPEFMKNSGNSLSPEEKALLEKFYRGEIPADSPDYEIAQALIGGDAAKKAMAQDILKARALGDAGLSDALTKKLTGAEMTPEEQALANNYSRDSLAKAYDNKENPELAAAYLKQAKGIPLTAEELARIRSTDDLGIDPKDTDALVQALTGDLANRQSEIDRLRQELADAQLAARTGATKLASGQILSPEEQAALQRFAELTNKIKELEDKQKQRANQISSEAVRLKSQLDRLGKTMRTIYPSGVSGVTADWANCNDARPFTIIRKKPTGKRKEIYATADGRELTPEQIQLLKAYRVSKATAEEERAKNRRDLLNPAAGLMNNAVALNSQQAGGDRGAGGGIQSLFLSDSKSLVPFKLSSAASIPAVLLTQILVSDKGQGQKVRVKILADVYDPKTKQIAIPKNSIVYGNSGSSFDMDTGTMNLNLDKVEIGGSVLDISFNVSSADLSPGLKGEVRDTRGKFLAGAFISAFSSGALGALSTNYIAPFRDSTLLSDSLIGTSMQGAAQVAQQIAELYAGDLQNAAKIFYAPAGIKVVLTPN